MIKARPLGIIVMVILAMVITTHASAEKKVKTPQQARLMAKRAAISDAQRNLAEIIYGVRLDSKTTVRNFVTENDQIRTRIHAVLRGATVLDTKWNPDGTCSVKMGVPVAMLQRALRRKFAYTSDVIRATGHGAPNPVARITPSGPTPSPEDSWHTLVIKATGTGIAPPEFRENSKGKLMSERAAHADALRQLGENIKGVHVTSRTTVRNFITQNDEIRMRFEAFLRGARKIETRHLEDGTCEVTLEIPLEKFHALFNPTPTPSPTRTRTRRKKPQRRY